jgi:hypothetical protein
MRTVAVPCLQSCTTKLQAVGPSCPAESTETCWSPLTLCRLQVRDPGPGPRHICILHNCNQKVQVRKKNMEKHSFSDGKRFTDFVLLRCFIDFLRKPWRDFRLQTSDFGLQTSGFRLQTSDFRLQTSDFRLQTSDFRLQTSDFGLRTSNIGSELR